MPRQPKMLGLAHFTCSAERNVMRPVLPLPAGTRDLVMDASVRDTARANEQRLSWAICGLRILFGPRPLVAILLLAATFGAVGTAAIAAVLDLPTPLLSADFDGGAASREISGVQLVTQFATPDVVPGVIGNAWRTDGFSSYAQASLKVDPDVGFTLSFWVALESFPSDREVPVRDLSPSSLAQQASGDAGFDLFLDTYGRWGLRTATTQGPLRIDAPRRFPLRRWTHVVASVDAKAGMISLFQDGALVATASAGRAVRLIPAQVPFKLAVPPIEAAILDFKINRINGAYDLLAVYPRPLTAAEMSLLPVPPKAPDAEVSLVVPATRFSADPLRPRVHPIPPANWTNEPHGLVRFGGAWHLFYQRTPNGPYKTQMHWGHLTSSDLVSWQSLPDALWPELQTADFGYDMKGAWSGDVIVDGNKAFAFYTSVNHGDRIAASNPGISMAVSEDPQLRDWRKTGPIINTTGVKDFRDPFLWEEGGTWHMLIGAALESGGGLEYLVLRKDEKGAHWERQDRFSDIAFRILDPGSVIWEMPVFERLSETVYVLVANPVGGKVSKYGEMPTRAVYWTGIWSNGLFKPFFKEPKNLDLVPGHLAPTVGRTDDKQLRAIGIIDERRNPASQLRAGWANMFSLPRTWTLLSDNQTLGQAPAPELISLRGAPVLEQDHAVIAREPGEIGRGLRAYELQLDLAPESGDSGALQIDVLASDDGREFTRLTFGPANESVVVDKSHSTLSTESEGPQVLRAHYATTAFGPMRRLRVFVDGSSIEVFINDAAAYAVRSYPTLAQSTGLRLSRTGERPGFVDLSLWPLRLPAQAAGDVGSGAQR